MAVGIPAELLLRRPDVRRALREAAAQSAQIGVAEADFYPRFGVSGFIGYAADDIRLLVRVEQLYRLYPAEFSVEDFELRTDCQQCPLAGRPLERKGLAVSAKGS